MHKYIFHSIYFEQTKLSAKAEFPSILTAPGEKLFCSSLCCSQWNETNAVTRVKERESEEKSAIILERETTERVGVRESAFTWSSTRQSASTFSHSLSPAFSRLRLGAYFLLSSLIGH